MRGGWVVHPDSRAWRSDGRKGRLWGRDAAAGGRGHAAGRSLDSGDSFGSIRKGKEVKKGKPEPNLHLWRSVHVGMWACGHVGMAGRVSFLLLGTHFFAMHVNHLQSLVCLRLGRVLF